MPTARRARVIIPKATAVLLALTPSAPAQQAAPRPQDTRTFVVDPRMYEHMSLVREGAQRQARWQERYTALQPQVSQALKEKRGDVGKLQAVFTYAQGKAATMNFVKSLAKQFAKKGIRVNGVAPGPIWTPLQVSGGASMEKLEQFGSRGIAARDKLGKPDRIVLQIFA